MNVWCSLFPFYSILFYSVTLFCANSILFYSVTLFCANISNLTSQLSYSPLRVTTHFWLSPQVWPHLHVPALLIVSLSLQHCLLFLLLQLALLQFPGSITGLDLYRKLWVHLFLQRVRERQKQKGNVLIMLVTVRAHGNLNFVLSFPHLCMEPELVTNILRRHIKSSFKVYELSSTVTVTLIIENTCIYIFGYSIVIYQVS